MTRQTMYIGIFMSAVLAAVYFWFGNTLFVSPDSGGSQVGSEYAGTLSRIERLRRMTLDTSVFQSEKFRRLREPAVPPLPDVKPGGRNPFLPL